jgi:C-terminal processing protease CtpA/Prc
VAALREEQAQPESDEVDSDYLRQAQQENFGFKEVKIIDGNIGYLNLSRFYHASIGGETAISAMNFLAHTDALIIDLRRNGGGSPTMIQLITSYLYGSEVVHLNTFYKRPSDSRKQTWTLPHIPGKRRPDLPVYVLISGSSFSAAEEFSYNLRNLERATLIGETTAGAAHSGGTEVVNDQFTLWVPEGRSINPITHTDWEGVGVKPHIEVNSKDALKLAHKQALHALAETNKGEDGFKYRWYIQSLNAKNAPIKLETHLLASYEGVYGPITISLENV